MWTDVDCYKRKHTHKENIVYDHGYETAKQTRYTNDPSRVRINWVRNVLGYKTTGKHHTMGTTLLSFRLAPSPHWVIISHEHNATIRGILRWTFKHYAVLAILTNFHDPEKRDVSNLLTPWSDWHVISPYNITPKSLIKVTRIKDMITNRTSSWFSNWFSWSAP